MSPGRVSQDSQRVERVCFSQDISSHNSKSNLQICNSREEGGSFSFSDLDPVQEDIEDQWTFINKCFRDSKHNIEYISLPDQSGDFSNWFQESILGIGDQFSTAEIEYLQKCIYRNVMTTSHGDLLEKRFIWKMKEDLAVNILDVLC